MNWRKANTVVPQFLGIDSVFKLVQLDKLVVGGSHSHMLPAQIPEARHLQLRVNIEMTDFPRIQHTEKSRKVTIYDLRRGVA